MAVSLCTMAFALGGCGATIDAMTTSGVMPWDKGPYGYEFLYIGLTHGPLDQAASGIAWSAKGSAQAQQWGQTVVNTGGMPYDLDDVSVIWWGKLRMLKGTYQIIWTAPDGSVFRETPHTRTFPMLTAHPQHPDLDAFFIVDELPIQDVAHQQLFGDWTVEVRSQSKTIDIKRFTIVKDVRERGWHRLKPGEGLQTYDPKQPPKSQ